MQAEDAGKCDQYVTPDTKYTAGSPLHDTLYGAAGFPCTGPLHYVFVARACLGHCVRTKDGRKSLTGDDLFAQGAGRKELAYVPGSNQHYHSLLAELGTSIVRYREFVTFHSDSYTKPEYLIAYTRTSS